MNRSRIKLGVCCCASLVLCSALVACGDGGASLTGSELAAAKVKPAAPPREGVNVYSMEITLADRVGDAVVSDGAGTYVHREEAIVELQAWEISNDQMYVKSAPGANSRRGRLRLGELDVECGNFQLKVYSANEFLDVAVGGSVFGTGVVMCTPAGAGVKERYQLDIGECIAIHRIAQDAWRVVSDVGCVGRLSRFKDTIGDYDVPFEFLAVLSPTI